MIAGEREMLARLRPLGACEPRQVVKLRGVRRLFADPDPDHAIAFDRLIHLADAQPQAGILAGGLQAAAFAVEEHAVIFAADVVALDHSPRPRHQAMRAAVVHRDDLAVRFAIENTLYAP